MDESFEAGHEGTLAAVVSTDLVDQFIPRRIELGLPVTTLDLFEVRQGGIVVPALLRVEDTHPQGAVDLRRDVRVGTHELFRGGLRGVVAEGFELLVGRGATFLSYTLIVLLSFLLKSKRVTPDVIYAALIGYLLMGLMWAGIYSLIDTITPGSFDVLHGWSENPRLVYLYFSYVTLTTLGYGDITPLTALAYSFSILEAIIGQIYLTVLVARLVGMHITNPNGGSPNGSDR